MSASVIIRSDKLEAAGRDRGTYPAQPCATRDSAQIKLPKIDTDTASRSRLIEHIEELEFILSDLIPAEGDAERLSRLFGLTRGEARHVSCLLDGRFHTRRFIRTATAQRGDTDAINNVDVVIYTTRKKLRHFGIEIIARRGLGFCMPADSLARLKSILNGEV